MKYTSALRFSLATLLLSASALHAADAPPGSISGTVVNAAGEKAVGIHVKLYSPNRPGGPVGAGGGSRHSSIFQPNPTFLDDRDGVQVADLVTDADGKFALKIIKPGRYKYTAGDPETVGYGLGSVTVESKKEATIAIKLIAPG